MRKITHKLLTLFLLAIVALSGSAAAYAQSRHIDIVGMSILDKSDTVMADEPVISGNIINSRIEFNKLNDYVQYELTLKNNDSEKFRITSAYDNNSSEYIALTYDYSSDYFAQGDVVPVTIKISYIKQLVNADLSLEDFSITISYENEAGEDGEVIIVPNTGFQTHVGGLGRSTMTLEGSSILLHLEVQQAMALHRVLNWA